jgi:spore germination protein YaaH
MVAPYARHLFSACTIFSALACASIHARPSSATEFWAFTAPWDPRSITSVASHAQSLDAVISGWIALDSTSFRPVALYPDTTTPPTRPRHLALVTSYQGSRFHPEILRGLSEDSIALGHTAGAIATLATRYSGIVFDFEGMTPADLPVLLAVTKSFADSAHAHNIPQVGLAIPAPDTAAYPARPLLRSLDFLVVMLYDQHWLTSPPGPIAAPDWARRQLAVRIGEVGPAKLVAAYPLYGYQWRSDSATAVISYDDAKRLATTANVPLTREPSSTTLHADTDTWHLWLSDAILLDTLVHDAQATGITKFALWRLGLEDPAIWTTVVHH